MNIKCNYIGRLGASVCLVILSGCGGGGDSAPTTPTQPAVTQDIIKNVATLGVAANYLTQVRITPALFLLAANLDALAVDTGGSGVRPIAAVACSNGIGTRAMTITKNGAHAGLISGDQVALTFSKCDVGLDGYVASGTAKLTVQNTINTFSLTNINIAFGANLNGLSIASPASTTTFSGAVDVVVNSTLNSDGLKMSVPANEVMSASMVTGTSSIGMMFGAGSTFAMTEFATPGSTTLKFDGSVSIVTGGAVVNLTISTPVALAGPSRAGTVGLFVPTSGVVTAKSTPGNVLTSTTFSGTTATVSGDTDGNGTLDLVFKTTWADLMSR